MSMSHNKLPLFDDPVDEWELRVNLMVQDDNEYQYWLDHIHDLCGAVVYDKKIEKDIRQICIKLSKGYIKRDEKSLSIQIPIVIKNLISLYLFEKPCIYDEIYPEWFDKEGFETKEWMPILDCCWKRKYSTYSE